MVFVAMALADDIAGDWQFFDGVEDATFQQQNVTPLPAAIPCKVLRQPLQTFLASTGIGELKLRADDSVYSIFKGTMGANPPTPKDEDKLTVGGVHWRILGTFTKTLSTRFDCIVRKYV